MEGSDLSSLTFDLLAFTFRSAFISQLLVQMSTNLACSGNSGTDFDYAASEAASTLTLSPSASSLLM